MRAIQVSLVNEDKGYIFSEWIDKLDECSWLGDDSSMGDIYRAYQSEYGRCQSKVYRDTTDGPRQVGWYFVSRQRYEDDTDTYLCGAWVTVGEYVPGVPEHVS